jgi:hypothetical protein
MKLMHGLLIVTVTGSMLWAQAPTQPGAKPPAQALAKPAAASPKPVANATTAKPMPAQSAKATTATATKPASAPAKPAASATTAKPAATQTTKAPTTSATKAPTATIPKPAPAQAVKPVKAQPVVKPGVVDKSAAAEKKVAPFAPKSAPKPAEAATVPANPAIPAMVKEEDQATRVSAVRGNRRDPFVSPIVKASGGGGPACETGKRCLMVDQIQLKGIVKSPNGYIAVVENAAKRAYFLRENDPVFNGSVVRITGDSVIFREQTVDKLGKQSMREVTKKVNAPVV